MGRRPIPLLRDLLPRRAAAGAIATYATGVLATAAGFLSDRQAIIRAGALVAALGAIGLFGALVFVLLLHQGSTRAPEHRTARADRTIAAASQEE